MEVKTIGIFFFILFSSSIISLSFVIPRKKSALCSYKINKQ